MLKQQTKSLSIAIVTFAFFCLTIVGCDAFEPIVWEKEIIQGTVLASHKHPLTEQIYVKVELDSGKVVSIKTGRVVRETSGANRKVKLIRGKKVSGKEFYKFIFK